MGYELTLDSLLLHFSEKEYVLLKAWKTGSVMGMFGSTLIVFLICIVHEALEGLRYFLAKEHSICDQDDSSSIHSRNASTQSVQLSLLRKIRRSFTSYRVTQALLYGVQTLIGFLLVLIVIRFNVWLLLAVVLGKAAGYFIFTGSPTIERASSLTNDHSANIPLRRATDFHSNISTFSTSVPTSNKY